nr:MAG TPA: hypothetical protein [Caudoviricetes sp.]
MIKYSNLKSEEVENPEKVIKEFSKLLYGNEAGSAQIDKLLEIAMKNGLIEEKEKIFVFYTWLTIDGFEKKYYKACGNDLTTKLSGAWVYKESELGLYEAYSKKFELEELEKGE